MARQDPYLYDDVPVLRNLPGIKKSEKLKHAEGDLTKMSMGIVYAREYDKFNTETLCDIHRTIFGALYEWAGEFRTIPIMKAEEVLGTIFKFLSDTAYKSWGTKGFSELLAG